MIPAATDLQAARCAACASARRLRSSTKTLQDFGDTTGRAGSSPRSGSRRSRPRSRIGGPKMAQAIGARIPIAWIEHLKVWRKNAAQRRHDVVHLSFFDNNFAIDVDPTRITIANDVTAAWLAKR